MEGKRENIIIVTRLVGKNEGSMRGRVDGIMGLKKEGKRRGNQKGKGV